MEELHLLSDPEYDTLLAENVVFLLLGDCSAVNTVIECIVRATPIVVNRHPAIEEALGSDYPGFYDTLEQAAAIVNDPSAIHAMHEHIGRIDLDPFRIATFVRSLHTLIGTTFYGKDAL